MLKSQATQLLELAQANGWSVRTEHKHYGLWFYRDNSAGITSAIGVRVGKRNQVVAAYVSHGDGVIYTPRVGKFREVCVELSKKNV